MHKTDMLTVGEVARRSGFAASAVRYYDRLGLISSVRTAGDQRRYTRGVLRRLAFIRAARNVGLTLDEVAESLSLLPKGRTPTKADWAKLSAGWRERLTEQIQSLETLRDSLDQCIGCGCLSLRACAFSNPDDGLSALGPGATMLPRRLREPGTT